MLGLFGILNLGTRSLQTQQTGVEVTGQNLANVNNPAYARQRVQIQTTVTIPTPVGPEGTGAEVVAIQQLRNYFLDAQIRGEQSVGGYWDAQQNVLHTAQAALAEFLDLNADNVSGAATAGGAGPSTGLADGLTNLFNAFQSVATSPTSLPEREDLISQAQSLASQFNQIAQRLTDMGNGLNTSLKSDVSSSNQLLSDIAGLNDQIARSEFSTGGTANDLRDLREQKLEQLSKFVNYQASTGADGSVDITIDGNQMISGKQVLDTMETYTGGNGQLYVRTATSLTPMALTSGSLAGTIDARDGTLQDLRTSLDTLAGTLITTVNNVHNGGFSLTGSTGANFFTGTDAATIGVNNALVNDPSLIQAAGVAGVPGDNSVALALAQLAQQTNGALGNQTFSDAYGQAVGDFGQGLKNANDQLSDHTVVNTMLLKQRDSVSGVSIDEEMTNLITFQKAYQASARIVTTVDDMLDTVINMKR
jgi:flagellar hook-associated protein 1 FlgK